MRTVLFAALPGRRRLLPKAANVHPGRLALGLRAKVIASGVRVHERTRVEKLGRDGTARTAAGHTAARRPSSPSTAPPPRSPGSASRTGSGRATW